MGNIQTLTAVKLQNFLFLLLLALPTLAAVGTKKKKQKIHVRREFVAFTDIQPPQEYHNDSGTYHRLHCRNSGLEKCDWKFPPHWKAGFLTLKDVDWIVAGVARQLGDTITPRDKPRLILKPGKFTIRWWRLSNGYEYVVEEGDIVLPAADTSIQLIL